MVAAAAAAAAAVAGVLLAETSPTESEHELLVLRFQGYARLSPTFRTRRVRVSHVDQYWIS